MSRSRHLIATLFAWNDLLWTLVGAFMVLMVVYVTQIQEQKKDESVAEDVSAGAVSVYVFWPDGLAADIDTHLKDPKGDHVYYNNREGEITNLLRDDLGTVNDDTPRNFENAYIRSLPGGEYIVAIHAFDAPSNLFPIPVEVELNFVSQGEGKQQVRFKHTVRLYRKGEEVTAFQFKINASGELVPGSVTNFQQPFIFGDRP